MKYIHVTTRTLHSTAILAIPVNADFQRLVSSGGIYWDWDVSEWKSNTHVAVIRYLSPGAFAPNTFLKW